jgi:hypothetical protein
MQPEGFVKERDLRLRRYVPIISFSDESSDVIVGTVQLGLFEKREVLKAMEAGENVFTVFTAFGDVGESDSWRPGVLIQVVDTSTGLTPATTAFTVDVTAGTADSGDGTCTVVAVVDDDGKVQFDLTDVASASGATLQVIVTVLNTGSTSVGVATFD